MIHSETLAALGAALAKAQAEIQGAKKDKKNPHLGSTYADLASIWDACREALTKNGLSVVQPFSESDRQVVVNTLLLHESGEWIQGTLALSLPMETKLTTAQAMGSIITYLRRYSLAAMVGVAPDDDNDAMAAPMQAPYAAAAAAAPMGLDTWDGPDLCPRCHAPSGKRHGKPCVA